MPECRRQQVPRQQDAGAVVGRVRGEARRPLLPEEIRDAISGDLEQPAGDVLDRHQEAVCLDERRKDVLQDVLDVERIGDSPANEVVQPGSLPLDDFRDSPVLLASHRLEARVVHLLMKTEWGARIL